MSVTLTVALSDDWLERYEIKLSGAPDDLMTLWVSAMLKGLTDAGVPARAVKLSTVTEDIAAWVPPEPEET